VLPTVTLPPHFPWLLRPAPRPALSRDRAACRHLWLMRINPVGAKGAGGGSSKRPAAGHDKKIHRFVVCAAMGTLLERTTDNVVRFGTLNDTWETMRTEQLVEAAAQGLTLPVANDPNWPSVEWCVRVVALQYQRLVWKK